MAAAMIEIARDADTVYEALCDIQNIPKWVRGVAKVNILETDGMGRPTVVQFVSMPARASVSYTLRYAYSPAARELQWEAEDKKERTVEGRAKIDDLGQGRCRLHYQLDTWNAASIPMWARAALRQDGPESTVRAFQNWIENRD